MNIIDRLRRRPVAKGRNFEVIVDCPDGRGVSPLHSGDNFDSFRIGSGDSVIYAAEDPEGKISLQVIPGRGQRTYFPGHGCKVEPGNTSNCQPHLESGPEFRQQGGVMKFTESPIDGAPETIIKVKKVKRLRP